MVIVLHHSCLFPMICSYHFPRPHEFVRWAQAKHFWKKPCNISLFTILVQVFCILSLSNSTVVCVLLLTWIRAVSSKLMKSLALCATAILKLLFHIWMRLCGCASICLYAYGSDILNNLFGLQTSAPVVPVHLCWNENASSPVDDSLFWSEAEHQKQRNMWLNSAAAHKHSNDQTGPTYLNTRETFMQTNCMKSIAGVCENPANDAASLVRVKVAQTKLHGFWCKYFSLQGRH